MTPRDCVLALAEQITRVVDASGLSSSEIQAALNVVDTTFSLCDDRPLVPEDVEPSVRSRFVAAHESQGAAR